jgi:hypothetical protein
MLSPSQHLPARTGCAGRLANSPRNGQEGGFPSQFRVISSEVVKLTADKLSSGVSMDRVVAWLCSLGAFRPSAVMLCRLISAQ